MEKKYKKNKRYLFIFYIFFIKINIKNPQKIKLNKFKKYFI